MLALVLLALVPIIMWVGQSALLLSAGMPIRGRISSANMPKHLKQANRVLTNTSVILVLLLYPLLRGQSPITYYGGFLPLGTHPVAFAHGLAASVIYLSLLYLAWLVTDNVRFRIRHRPAVIVRRLMIVPFTAMAGAAAEELLFRSMLLAGLLESFSTAVAVVVGLILFAGAHYVRQVKRYWTFGGHLALGLLLCVAFVCTRSLWLPMGLHAGGILILMSFRPFLRYHGPGWLLGASVFPYAGAAGIAGLILLTLSVWLHYGVTP